MVRITLVNMRPNDLTERLRVVICSPGTLHISTAAAQLLETPRSWARTCCKLTSFFTIYGIFSSLNLKTYDNFTKQKIDLTYIYGSENVTHTVFFYVNVSDNKNIFYCTSLLTLTNKKSSFKSILSWLHYILENFLFPSSRLISSNSSLMLVASVPR